MTRTETLAQINALPVSDAVNAHACRLIEGLPEWCPMPDSVCYAMKDECALEWGHVRTDTQPVDDNLWVHVFGDGTLYHTLDWWNGENLSGDVTTPQVHELLRQLTGMVALTGGG